MQSIGFLTEIRCEERRTNLKWTADLPLTETERLPLNRNGSCDLIFSKKENGKSYFCARKTGKESISFLFENTKELFIIHHGNLF